MGKRRRRLDPVGPFGNPDGSRADIEDLVSEFVDFGGDPAYGHLATRANDSMVRVIVGKLGAGKTVYLRRLQNYQAHQDSVYADVPQQSLPKTEVVVKACQWFSDRVLVEKWMQIWECAILRSLASHLLRRPELRQQLRDEQADEIERSYARLLEDFRRPRSIYSQVRDIINQRQTGHQLSTYLDDPLWDDLEDLLGEVIGQCKPIYFYLDALDEEFSHAPMYWLKCQEGLFYQVMRLLRDHKLGGRLHIVVCIRDIVMSSVYRSEHAPRYYNEPHIRVLTWDRSALLYLLQQKLQRLPPSLLMRRPASGPPTIRDWLGVNGDWPGPDGDGTLEDYLLSHTRLIPRDIISLGNELNEEILRQKQAGHEGLPPAALQGVVQRCAKRFGDSQLAQCANQISSDLMPKNAALHNYSELFTSTQVLGQGGFSKVYRVRDEVEAEERALKLFDSAAGYEAVRREIGALRKIHHPNVVEVFWAGKTNIGDWYLITEFIDGESLSEFAAGKKRLRDREAVDVALDLLGALVAFHPDAARLRQLDAKDRGGDLSGAERGEWMALQDKGLVHRDIKPLNVILTRTGAKLLDFNIASRVGDPVRTQSGTPPYQPPDADLTRWDVSTDLFAVGVLLYQLLCDGRHPFQNAMPMVGRRVIDPRTVRRDLGPELAEFLTKACAPANADRFATAAEMQHTLRVIRANL
jgi:hypothetical protein